MSDNKKIYNVIITETAWEQILEHARFLAEVSLTAANRLVDDFIKCCDTLTFMPERCSWFEHNDIPYQKYRKRFIGKNYIALFLINDGTVNIVAALDCRREYGWMLDK